MGCGTVSVREKNTVFKRHFCNVKSWLHVHILLFGIRPTLLFCHCTNETMHFLAHTVVSLVIC